MTCELETRPEFEFWCVAEMFKNNQKRVEMMWMRAQAQLREIEKLMIFDPWMSFAYQKHLRLLQYKATSY